MTNTKIQLYNLYNHISTKMLICNNLQTLFQAQSIYEKSNTHYHKSHRLLPIIVQITQKS